MYIASSHTHSGGGAYLDIPILGESLAGSYCAKRRELCIKQTVDAIFQAIDHPIEGQVGIGYGDAQGLSKYRGLWPKNISPLSDIAIIKVARLDDSPFAVVFNYPLHPTVLKGENLQFSSDFVGYARKHLQSLLGSDVEAIYLNGAQAEILPNTRSSEGDFATCERIGRIPWGKGKGRLGLD